MPMPRLTPAHAGKTTQMMAKYCMLTGSPPHTRGKLMALNSRRLFPRLTPAHAGKTKIQQNDKSRQQAHPRTRGENGGMQGSILGAIGSPPHTRGKRLGIGRQGHVGGLTPAHAGKTILRIGGNCMFKAHPRTRGENLPSFLVDLGHEGSPPHTRGKP